MIKTKENLKPFKTLRTQLKILRGRGLKVPADGKPMRALERIGYYTLINGYKTLFLTRDTKGNVIHPEVFIKESSFDEILALYHFDKELRAILYTALLEYETNLGAELAYRFSESFPDENSYLAIDNFNGTNISSIVGTISSLSNTIKNMASVKKNQQNAIKHYVNKHGHVPLWVLVNFLTFGELNYFYRNCQDNVQVAIAKDFSSHLRREYSKKYATSITPETINAINHLANHFRNAVAHNEITYSKRLSKSPDLRSIKNILSLPVPLSSQAGIFELVMSLKIVLPKKDYLILSKALLKLLDNYKKHFHSVNFNAILQDMNFPLNYKEFLAVTSS
ncbi:Abi family protein [Ligilactobacillus agilis]|uniref:Abi family protein n=1 Tax=Ligilactobacillus agilis TaxID=1601 RepID=UPI0025A33E04|nr:Abi family protein [Ligilactobacillus agilis]MDM8279682.1 Abi family protein [Ligilactobacillus agilis]